MLRPSIGIDWDDVTAPFNSIAIRMANEKYHPKEPYRMEEITSWANEGRTSVIKEFYNDPELYRRQIPTEEMKRGIRRLMQIADVFFITAVSLHFMGVRAEQIMTQFPELHRKILFWEVPRIVSILILCWMMPSTIFWRARRSIRC